MREGVAGACKEGCECPGPSGHVLKRNEAW